MKCVSEIFDEIGGSGQMARALDVKPSAASEMKRRGSIPVRYWPQLVEACRARGVDVTYEQLVNLHLGQAAQ